MADSAPLLAASTPALAEDGGAHAASPTLKPAASVRRLGRRASLEGLIETTATVMSTFTFVRAVSWMFWAGFGAPWVLFAMIGAIVSHFYPQSIAVLSSNGFFYSSVLGSIGVAVGRTAVILKITFDREAQARKAGSVDPEPISHRHYWWCNTFGLVISCVFVLGDGIGRIFVPATALNFISVATWEPAGLFAASNAYFYTIFAASFVSGAYRLVWWIWYWFTFSEVNEKVRAGISDDAAEDIIDDPASSDTAAAAAAIQVNDGLLAIQSAPGAIKRFLSNIYPQISRAVPRTGRHLAKRAYAFAGGFGCTWAIFSVINACINHVSGVAPLVTEEWYLWMSVAMCIVGGFYGGLYGGDKRFKVFLH